MVGTNSRLDALQAAVLRAKLPHLDGWTRARQANAARYDEALSGSAIGTPEVASGNEHVYNQYTVRVPERDRVRQRLEDAEIGTGVYYPVPLHLQECFAGLGGEAGDHPESERAAREVLSLPIYAELGTPQQQYVIDALLSAVND
jgi:dTDP-4-amino-4,6-dideoxygalactose transaminase